MTAKSQTQAALHVRACDGDGTGEGERLPPLDYYERGRLRALVESTPDGVLARAVGAYRESLEVE
jgi:hypothetical protein